MMRGMTLAATLLFALSACGGPRPGAELLPRSTGVQAQVADPYAGCESLRGMALMRALSSLVRARHVVLGYDRARDVMFATLDDIGGRDTVVDVYCGRTGKGVRDRVSAFHRGLNAEHTWPQSLGAQAEPARSDLHHLFPADADTNSQRNRHRLGVPEQVTETLPNYLGDALNSRVGTLADGTVVFEPRDDHKGDAARAMLYFYVRYGFGARLTDGVKLDNFRGEFATLWRWHFIDPVSPKEKARNEAIARLQGNRNPFIDHPEYVQRIGHFLSPGRQLEAGLAFPGAPQP